MLSKYKRNIESNWVKSSNILLLFIKIMNQIVLLTLI